MPILSGMVYCADCGKKLYQVRGKGWSHDKEYMVCSSYRKISKQTCSSHQIRNVVFEKVILQRIQYLAKFVQENEKEFIEMVTKHSKENADKQLKDSKKEYESLRARYSKLDSIIQHLYEDNLEGKITDDRFIKLSMNYETEQATIKSKLTELESFIKDENDRLINAESFIKHVRKYTDVAEIDCEMVRELISKVIVHSATKENGQRTQRIDILFNGLDNIDLFSQ